LTQLQFFAALQALQVACFPGEVRIYQQVNKGREFP
jgi:hypothetical protein